jgi:pimeloyl-ACP methyl ester carboxylesterase
VLQWEFSGGPNTVSSDTDGHTVHYVDEGSGPTLLFLHGNPTWSFVYRDVIRSLRDEFRCIAVDYPGFGLSSAAPGYRYLPEDHAPGDRSLRRHPTVRIQQLAGADGGKAYADALRDLFELDPRATAAITTPLHGAS